MHIDTIPVPPLGTNCYFLRDPATSTILVIDPGGAGASLAPMASDYEKTEILLTHAHFDHLGGVPELYEEYGCVPHLHPNDLDLYHSPVNCLPPFPAIQGLPEPQNLSDIRIEGIDCQVLHTPGHTRGGCCIYFPADKAVFVGDTLFAGSIGRTDLPGGDTEQLLDSIKTKLLALDDDVVVYPGHGPSTTIGKERMTNPYLQGL